MIKVRGCNKTKTRSQEAIEGDGGGCQVLNIQQGPTCSTPLQNPVIVEERQHIPSIKKLHDKSLHTKTFDSNLDMNYILLHPSIQTHNYSTSPTTQFQRNTRFMTFFLLFTKMEELSTSYFTYNHVRDIFPMLWRI